MSDSLESKQAAPSARPSPQAPATVPAQPRPSDEFDPEAEPAEPEEIPDELNFSNLLAEFEQGQEQPAASSSGVLAGEVVSIRDDGFFIDISRKSEAFLPLDAANDIDGNAGLKIGDSIEVSITGRSPDGYLTLSRVIAERPKNWDQFEVAFENGTAIAGKVTEVIKGGLAVDVGVRAFLPASKSGIRETAEMEKLVGQEIRCRISQLDVDDENIIVDRRVLLEEEREQKKQERIAALRPEMVVEGTVRELRDFGAFVDLGGVDALLHVSDLAWEKVKDVSSVLSVGDSLKVKVLKIEEGGKRISAGLKQLTPDPWTLIADKLSVGDRIKGPVTKLMDFGAFVELEPGVEGLVHVSEMSWARRVQHPKDLVSEGDIVDVVVLEIKAAQRRIGLGIKQALGDPWEKALEKFPVGKVLEGTVRNIAAFGAFVEISEGIEGLVHVSDFVSDRRINHPSEVVKAGEKVQVAVTEIDAVKRRLKLRMKDIGPNDQDLFIEEYKPGDMVTGRVSRIKKGKAMIDLGEGVEAVCSLAGSEGGGEAAAPAADAAKDVSSLGAMLASAWKGDGDGPSAAGSRRDEKLEQGQVRSFKITHLDAKTRAIELSLA